MAEERIRIRRDTAANWTSNNPTLGNGEPGYETDTNKLKIGDGSTAWTSLDYRFTLTDLGVTAAAQTILDDATIEDINVTLGVQPERPIARIQQVGSTFSLTGTYSLSYATAVAPNEIQIHVEGKSAFERYRWNAGAGTWALLDSDAQSVNYNAISALSYTDFAFVTGAGGGLYRYRYNGSAYSLIGSALNIGSSSSSNGCAALDADTVVVVREAGSVIKIYTWGGSSWSETATLSSSGFSGSVCVAALGHRQFAILDNGNTRLSTYQWDGSTTISLVGNHATVAADTSAAITAISDSAVLYVGTSQDDFFVYEFDGTDWFKTLEQSVGVSLTTKLGLCMINKTDFAIINSDLGLRTYRLVYDRDAGPYSVAGGAFGNV